MTSPLKSRMIASERLLQSAADGIVIDTEHVCVVGQCPGPNTEHEPAHQLMVKLNRPIRPPETDCDRVA